MHWRTNPDLPFIFWPRLRFGIFGDNKGRIAKYGYIRIGRSTLHFKLGKVRWL
jgi:hypothetical protein